ncbi:hypothetical protein [Bradyrhizobium canariense]|uniref:hypothetical protein n=1 Tax=Bradyrhizobium canariense TaxID=255045 RepID=UPI0013747349|nr:hypothetical protein [Bradyrhizobium canariense]
MPKQFSPETQELLDRAQRAIDEAASLRQMIRMQLSDAERQSLLLEMMRYRKRDQARND